ncbi:hypothetical protein [Desertimonas flava]|uniref:hypothetical protein n=1 Tax=Desertimonas flava TaxID=2064846 RepID=UPI003C6C2557
MLSSHLPKQPSDADAALRAAGPDTIFDAVAFTSRADIDRLRLYAKGGYTATPQPGFWRPADLP